MPWDPAPWVRPLNGNFASFTSAPSIAWACASLVRQEVIRVPSEAHFAQQACVNAYRFDSETSNSAKMSGAGTYWITFVYYMRSNLLSPVSRSPPKYFQNTCGQVGERAVQGYTEPSPLEIA